MQYQRWHEDHNPYEHGRGKQKTDRNERSCNTTKPGFQVLVDRNDFQIVYKRNKYPGANEHHQGNIQDEDVRCQTFIVDLSRRADKCRGTGPGCDNGYPDGKPL